MSLNIYDLNLIISVIKMVVLMDGGAGGASSMSGRLPDHLRKHRTNERQYVFDVAFGADSTQVQLKINVGIIKQNTCILR